jgi:ATP-dependent DNA helicase RecQ
VGRAAKVRAVLSALRAGGKRSIERAIEQLPLAPRAPTPRDVLTGVFGYDDFRPGQARIIDAVLAGRDCIGVMPTGAGKSLTFQIPARLLDGTVLVVSPLISLMKDQVDALVRNGFRAAVVNSSLELDARRETLRRLRAGEYELVYVAPEGLEGSLRNFLAGVRISLVVVDEAHCISEWGHDFRPAYRRLRGLKQELGGVPILALTATATRRVAGDIIRQLGMVKPDGFKGSFYRANLALWAHKKGDGRGSRKDLLAYVRRRAGESGIIYTLSRKNVESLAEYLRAAGVRAVPYHAGLDDVTRARHQDAFARDEVDVVVATIAFGMGIDKSNVRYVIHREMPRSIESYYQEIGRAGRDGLASDCILLYSWADVISHERFQDQIDDPDLRAATRDKTRAMFNLADAPGCRQQRLVAYFEETMEPCGAACDQCRGATVLDLFHAPVGHGARRGVEQGEAATTNGGRVSREGVALRGTRAAALDGIDVRARDRTVLDIADLDADADALFQRLRAVRRALADAERVPAYIVFSDAVLARMAAAHPTDEAGLLAISGVGPAKLARYGEAFLRALRE